MERCSLCGKLWNVRMALMPITKETSTSFCVCFFQEPLILHEKQEVHTTENATETTATDPQGQAAAEAESAQHLPTTQ